MNRARIFLLSILMIIASITDQATADEPARVAASENGIITLNRGASFGVHSGDLYLVYMDGKAIRDIDGTVLGVEALNIAIVEVFDVQDRYSRASIFRLKPPHHHTYTGDTAFIHAGDKARSISHEEVSTIIKQGLYTDSRQDNNASTTYNPFPISELGVLSYSNLERISTNPNKVIAGYDLTDEEKQARISAHRKLVTAQRDRNTYNSYVALANSYDGDYLAAYQAGATALALGMIPEAYGWYGRALEINPDYKPAQDGRDKTQQGGNFYNVKTISR